MALLRPDRSLQLSQRRLFRRLWQPFRRWLCLPKPLLGMGWYPCCGVTADCCDGTVPTQLQVTFSDIAEDGCGDCDTLNDSFIVDLDIPEQTDINCTWYYYFDSQVCNVDDIQVMVQEAGNWLVAFGSDNAGGYDVATWYKTGLSIPPSCSPEDQDVPFFSQSLGEPCDYSPSSCTVTTV